MDTLSQFKNSFQLIIAHKIIKAIMVITIIIHKETIQKSIIIIIIIRTKIMID